MAEASCRCPSLFRRARCWMPARGVHARASSLERVQPPVAQRAIAQYHDDALGADGAEVSLLGPGGAGRNVEHGIVARHRLRRHVLKRQLKQACIRLAELFHHQRALAGDEQR